LVDLQVFFAMAKSTPPPASPPGYDPVEAGFLDARGKLIDVAAFLDRVERRGRTDDYRVEAIKQALEKLISPDVSTDRAGAVLRVLSDPTSAPVEKAGSPAAGAWKSEPQKSPKRRKQPSTRH
jgi:hypothetical protein